MESSNNRSRRNKRYDEHRTPLENNRTEYAKSQIEALGYTVTENPGNRSFKFEYKGNPIRVFPYKGWFTGKGIKDGRGIKNLLKQIRN